MARRGGAPGGTRQRKHWHGTINTTQKFVGASTGILANFPIDSPATILRTLGQVLLSASETDTVAGDQCAVTLGLCVVSTDAFTVGASAMPDPASEPEFDWLWWHSSQFFIPATPLGRSLGEVDRVTIASKAMRRVSHSEQLVLLGEYVNIAGSPPIDVSAGIRFLIGE